MVAVGTARGNIRHTLKARVIQLPACPSRATPPRWRLRIFAPAVEFGKGSGSPALMKPESRQPHPSWAHEYEHELTVATFHCIREVKLGAVLDEGVDELTQRRQVLGVLPILNQFVAKPTRKAALQV